MKSDTRAARLRQFVIILCIYAAVDLPTRFVSFSGLEEYPGLANFLPITMGLLLGLSSIAPMCLANVLCAVIAGAAWKETAASILAILITASGAWVLWFADGRQRVCLKKGKDYLRFILIAAASSLLGGLPTWLLVNRRAWIETTVSYAIISVIVGIPVIILAVSILCVAPLDPKGRTLAPDVLGTIGASAAGLSEVNEQIERICGERKIPMKRQFDIENCVEELILRIQETCGDLPVQVEIQIEESTSLRFIYGGVRFNPLCRKKGETAADMIGLLLIRQRALRASYQRSKNLSQLHVVV